MKIFHRAVLFLLFLIFHVINCWAITATWAPPLRNCDNSPVTNLPITYNFYAAPLPGGIPISAQNAGCGRINMIDRTQISAINTSPISAQTFTASLADGKWQIGIEAVDSTGAISEGVFAEIEIVNGKVIQKDHQDIFNFFVIGSSN